MQLFCKHVSVGRDGQTPFKRHHKDSTSQLLPFGAAVDAKVRYEETERNKFDSRVIPSIWPGRAAESDGHSVGTALVDFKAKTGLSNESASVVNLPVTSSITDLIGSSSRCGSIPLSSMPHAQRWLARCLTAAPVSSLLLGSPTVFS